jgi:hypothetical protein
MMRNGAGIATRRGTPFGAFLAAATLFVAHTAASAAPEPSAPPGPGPAVSSEAPGMPPGPADSRTPGAAPATPTSADAPEILGATPDATLDRTLREETIGGPSPGHRRPFERPPEHLV